MLEPRVASSWSSSSSCRFLILVMHMIVVCQAHLGPFGHYGMQKVMVPAYFGSNSTAPYDAIRADSASYLPGVMIIKPYVNSTTGVEGPGMTFDAFYAAQINATRAIGWSVIGYVKAPIGTRLLSDVIADCDRYFAWYNLNGIYLDAVDTLPSSFGFYSNVTVHIRSALGVNTSLVLMATLDGSTPLDPRFYTIGDTFVLGVHDVSVPPALLWMPPKRRLSTGGHCAPTSVANACWPGTTSFKPTAKT